MLLKQEGTIIGFATARICQEGCKIGPIVAPTPEDGYSLAVQAAAAIGRTEAIVDTPESASALSTLLETKGFSETFSTARMYRGPAPASGPTLQAIGTMELG